MELRWTAAAAADLERIADYLFEETREHVGRLINALYEAPEKLLEFPGLGRPGREAGTRELVVRPLPYLIIYVHDGEVIHIARILHGAQKWP